MEAMDPSKTGKGWTIDRLSGGVLILIGLVVLVEDRLLPLGSAHRPGPGYFPMLLAILLVICGAILAVRGKESLSLRSVSWAESFHAIPILGCCIFTTLFMEWIGYRITMLLVLGFLFGIIERISLWTTLILTFGLSLGSFWLFDTLLRVPLPRGWWGF
jgi:putative tricarboxylic transport membrane protein